MTKGFPDNETRCSRCGLTFDTYKEIAYDGPNIPVCPRCGSSKNFLIHQRKDGKILTI